MMRELSLIYLAPSFGLFFYYYFCGTFRNTADRKCLPLDVGIHD